MNMQTTGTVSSSCCYVPTLLERRGGAIWAFAYCPICDKVEKSDDKGRSQEHALDASVAKIRTHMRLAHNIP
jgi:hypothetical protein